ncbi:DUF2510 domain-containing protein [Nocardioides alkalitolerans]|uniref:DUF2510 domain-containing protein n=1 Tax=Nocardioides alkalitolerans TaxID=281714 RepID=UPI00048D4CDC|nr:DUF2510 domain-containing protein [Nocardioides alkalitolerans]
MTGDDSTQDDGRAPGGAGGPQPGWYGADPGAERWWDGTSWTAHTRPTPDPPAPASDPTADPMADPTADPTAAPTSGSTWVPAPAPAPVTNWRIVGPLIGGVVLVVALVVTLVVVLGGGSGPSSAPTDATEDDFCEAMDEVYGLIFVLAFQEGDQEWETGRMVDVLVDTGTPAGIEDDARAGFEELVAGLELADGMTYDELEESGEGNVSGDGDDSPESDAFETYTEETCGTPFGTD